jgi:PPOX class probable F420-dependent enzyme
MMATTNKEPKAERNIDGYGAPLIPWTKVRERLEQGLSQAPGSGGPDRHTCWLATVNPDGTPHVMPLGVLWVDDAFYFNAGAGTRKAKNLARDPHCALTVATHDFDLVVEGKATRVTERARVQRLAEAFRAQGWEATVTVTEGGVSLTAEYSAPSAGPPPWDVYEVTPETVFALGTAEPYGATRWRFA